MRILTISVLLAAGISSVAAKVSADSNILFILDGSNSMWGQIDGKPKIQTAQSVLTGLISDLPKNTRIGLMAYGHRNRESCDDIEILSAIGADKPADLIGKIHRLQPKGKTPIAGSLLGSTIAFRKLKGQNNHVVLISDGVETCGGDPCMAASVLANANISARVHVIGFGVNSRERGQLECIPKMGKGKYFSAANAGELKKAVAEVQKVAQQTPVVNPPPKKAGLKEFFRDNFDGKELSTKWEVRNPNPDAFIVEDGKLLIVSGTAGSLAKKVENQFSLPEKLPKGDWTITARFTGEFQTGKERAFIGIVDSDKNYLEISLQATTATRYNGSHYAAFNVVGVKRTRGKDKTTTRRLWNGETVGAYANAVKKLPQPIRLRLEKKGRSYIGSAMLEGAKKPAWVSLDKFTVLRLKGKVSVGFYQAGKTSGESTAKFDWVKIETPDQ